MKAHLKSFLFFLFIILISFYYNYQEIITLRPQSIHKWRQADCASLALNYYQQGMRFMQPETHNLTSDGGISGKNATSELPLLYYSVAILYKLFGPHEYFFRLLNTLLYFLGLFYLFRLFKIFLKTDIYAYGLSLLFFGSTVLAYYGNNFLSNIPALSFSIVGCYYLVQFYFQRHYRYFLLGIVFYFLAGAFKITALLSLFAFCGYFILVRLRLFNDDNLKKIKLGFQHILPLTIALFVIFGWILYADYYNTLHDTTYFSTTIFPLWKLRHEVIEKVLHNVYHLWFNDYFHVSIHLMLAVSFLFILCNIRKGFQFLNILTLLIFAGAVVYLILQFWTFADHDYYTIELYILPVFILLAAFGILKTNYPKIFNSIFLKVGLLLVVAFNIHFTKGKLTERYNTTSANYLANKDFMEMQEYLKSLGLTYSDTVIAIPDVSHASLYYLNVKGWTEYIDMKFNRGEKIIYNRDSVGIQQSINKGANYLIVNNVYQLFTKPYLKSYCKHLKGKYNNALIFDLSDTTQNFNFKERTVQKEWFCDAENISNDGNFFINPADSTLFEYGNRRDSSASHSGNFSCALNSTSPFGMTIRLSNLKEGQSFKVSVYRSPSNMNSGTLVASCNEVSFYQSTNTNIASDTKNWDLLQLEFFINKELANKELVVYLYNPEESTIYFDDLQITKYNGPMIYK